MFCLIQLAVSLDSVSPASFRLPTHHSARLVLISAWLVSVILSAIYTGNLTSFLSIGRTTTVPETVKQLTEMGYTVMLSEVHNDLDVLQVKLSFGSVMITLKINCQLLHNKKRSLRRNKQFSNNKVH